MTRADIEYAAKLYAEKGEYVYLCDSRPDMSEFFELMEMIETLCPKWPQRQSRWIDNVDFRL